MSGYSSVIKTKVRIGTTKPAAVLADYTSDTFTPVNGLTDIGEFGAEKEEIKFTTIEDGQVHKLNGSSDSGNWDVEIARDNADAGQIALRAAAKSEALYNFHVELVDGTDFYFRGVVRAAKNAFGSNDVNKQKFTVGIPGEILEVTAA